MQPTPATNTEQVAEQAAEQAAEPAEQTNAGEQTQAQAPSGAAPTPQNPREQILGGLLNLRNVDEDEFFRIIALLAESRRQVKYSALFHTSTNNSVSQPR